MTVCIINYVFSLCTCQSIIRYDIMNVCMKWVTLCDTYLRIWLWDYILTHAQELLRLSTY